MKRRAFLKKTSWFGLAAGAGLVPSALSCAGARTSRRGEKERVNPKNQRPNILFVFSDQQRWDTLGCYGQELDVTPNLDRLAAEGARFEYSFTCQPVCGPARASLQTGKYAAETGCYRNDIALPRAERTLAHSLGDAGYEIAYVGKWHLASTGKEDNFRERAVPLERRGGYNGYWVAADVFEFTSNSRRGFLFDADMNKVEFEGYRADCTTDFALEFLRQRKSDRPFFLFLSYIEPHHQNNANRFEGPDGSKERFGNFRVPGDLADTKGDWREQFPDYLGCINAIDRNVGRLRAELEKQGVADNTLIIYTSDHGCHFRTRNGEYKRSCHDASIRTPLIVAGPGFRGGEVVKELVSLIDLPPTVLAAGGAEVPGRMRGRPLQQLAQGAATDWPKEVFVQISESQTGRAIRTEKWKYCVKAPGGSRIASDRYIEHHLYDLEADPHERKNLIRDPSLEKVREDLARILKRRMVEAGEAEPVIQKSEAAG